MKKPPSNRGVATLFFHLRSKPAQQIGAEVRGQVAELDSMLAFTVRPGDATGKLGFTFSLRHGKTDRRRHSKTQWLLDRDGSAANAQVQQSGLSCSPAYFNFTGSFIWAR